MIRYLCQQSFFSGLFDLIESSKEQDFTFYNIIHVFAVTLDRFKTSLHIFSAFCKF